MRMFLSVMITLYFMYFLQGTTAADAEPDSANILVSGGYCEYRENPLGIDTLKPRLAWKLAPKDIAAHNLEQSAYQVLVASSKELLESNTPDLWDTGKIESNRQLHIEYEGQPLDSRQKVYWQVRVWDKDDNPSTLSDIFHWEMALLNQSDWKGIWIQEDKAPVEDENLLYDVHPAPMLRKSFDLRDGIVNARAYIAGLGYYELKLNGEKVGDLKLEPGWTAYRHRVFYSVYDVTNHLVSGENAAGILLGNGWYNPLPLRMWGRFNLREHLEIGEPRALLHLEVEYEDGTSELIVTDTSWKTAPSEIRKNNIYLGEMIDMRFAEPGWDTPGYDDSNWGSTIEAEENLGLLQAQPLPPIRIMDTISAKAITEPEPGVYIVDFGENLAGVIRLQVQGTSGTTLRARYGELLYPDGTLNPMTSVWGQVKNVQHPEGSLAPSTAWQEDNFILAGTGNLEIFQPRFTFHGFRYAEVTGHPDVLKLEDIVALRLQSDVTAVGQFESSNPLLNQIQEISVRALEGNLHSVQSDCPAREKFGYGGDIVAASEYAMFNKDMAAFYVKSVRDFGDEVRSNGGITETAPFVGIADWGMGEDSSPVGWGTVHPLLLWQLYQYYGEKSLLEDQYEIAKGWVELIKETSEGHLLNNCIGDHESIAPIEREVTTPAFYYYNTVLMARLAEILNKPSDVAYYEALANDIKTAFNGAYLEEETGKYGSGTQANQAFALFFDLVPEAYEPFVLNYLLQDIKENHEGRLSTGIFGTKYMLHTLADHENGEVAYNIINHREFPGWGYMIENGATTLWEHWAFSDNTFSHNHPMFGSVSEWFYKVLLGIQPALDAEGFDRVAIRPLIPEDLEWVQGSYDSIRGKISVAWKKLENNLHLVVEIPVGVTAVVQVPHAEGAEAFVDVSSTEVKQIDKTATSTHYTIGSGTYTFTSSL